MQKRNTGIQAALLSATFLGLAETLMLLMQQHNMKEEQVLYRMMDQVYGEEVNDLLKQAGSF